jgi:manganese/zinc/iron transport system permease protein
MLTSGRITKLSPNSEATVLLLCVAMLLTILFSAVAAASEDAATKVFSATDRQNSERSARESPQQMATLHPNDMQTAARLRASETMWWRVVTLQDYNTRIVVTGTMLLGLAAGMIGSFALLRKRALMGDALSHATLPGICIAFMAGQSFGFSGRSLPLLLAGAAISGLCGALSILVIRNLTRLKEDTALGIVLSVFFGAGVVLLSMIQQSSGHSAGLESFIYGKTASMIASDAWLIGIAGLGCVIVISLIFKELTLLCFDEAFAAAIGFPVLFIDAILMSLVVVITIIGLQAVGLVLMIAMLVIPAAAARFWSDDIRLMTLVSAGLGGASGLTGSAISAIFPKLPSGAMIVLVCSSFFFISMLTGPSRGLVVRFFRRWALNRAVNRQHLLRGLYEHLEAAGKISDSDSDRMAVLFRDLIQMRSWSSARLRRQIRRSEREGMIRRHPDQSVSLTPNGFLEAERLVHEHRLWELYLITHADVAPSSVDRVADSIEHVLSSDMIRQLEELLQRKQDLHGVIQSPHPIAEPASGDIRLQGGSA